MDAFLNWVLLAGGIVALTLFIRVSLKQPNIVHVCFSLSLLAFCANMVALLFLQSELKFFAAPALDGVSSWATISSAAFMLCAVTGLIREAKPTFARFPRIFCAFPLILIPLNVWGQHTLVLKDWMLALYLAGGLLIMALILTVFLKKDHSIWIIYLSLGLLSGAHITAWFNVIMTQDIELISWKILLTMGMILFSVGFHKVATQSSAFFSGSIFATSQHSIKNE